jgi:hypothetical protein
MNVQNLQNLGVQEQYATSDAEALNLALQATLSYPVILFTMSNIVTLYIIDQRPKSKYWLMFLNSLVSMYLLNLMSVRVLQQ